VNIPAKVGVNCIRPLMIQVAFPFRQGGSCKRTNSGHEFSRTEFELSKKYAIELQNKLDVFLGKTKTRKSLFLTMVSTHGIKNVQSYPGLVQSEVNMNDLFHVID